jgi:hypothetical protein
VPSEVSAQERSKGLCIGSRAILEGVSSSLLSASGATAALPDVPPCCCC